MDAEGSTIPKELESVYIKLVVIIVLDFTCVMSSSNRILTDDRCKFQCHVVCICKYLARGIALLLVAN